MTDIELLPLPEDAVEWLRQYGVANTAFQMEVIEGWFQAHARAVAEHNVKLATAELHRQFGCELRDPNGTIWEYAAAQKARAERLETALQMIAGTVPCPDSLMGNVDIAIAALRDHDQEGKDGQN